MKIPSIALVFLLPLAAAAQSPSAPQLTPPPIKMGLWKTTSTATIAGMQLPPEVEARLKAMGKSFGGPQTVNMLNCITREKWQQMFDHSQSQSCTFSNVQQSSSGMSADLACNSTHSTSTGHMQMTYDSSEKMHGSFHMQVTAASRPQPMTVDSTYQGAYQGSDCQGVSPDSPRILP